RDLLAERGELRELAVRRIDDQRCDAGRNLAGLGPMTHAHPAGFDLALVRLIAAIELCLALLVLLLRQHVPGAELLRTHERNARHMVDRPHASQVRVAPRTPRPLR